MPLHPVRALRAFFKMGHFIGTINLPVRHSKAKYIITATEYLLNRWAEAEPVKDCYTQTAVRFLFQYILFLNWDVRSV